MNEKEIKKIKIISVEKDYGSKIDTYNGKQYTKFSKLCNLDIYGRVFVNSYSANIHNSIIANSEHNAEMSVFEKKDGSGQGVSFAIKAEKKENNFKSKYPERVKTTINKYLLFCEAIYNKANTLNKDKSVELFQVMMNNAGFYTDPTQTTENIKPANNNVQAVQNTFVENKPAAFVDPWIDNVNEINNDNDIPF